MERFRVRKAKDAKSGGNKIQDEHMVNRPHTPNVHDTIESTGKPGRGVVKLLRGRYRDYELVES